MAKKRRESAVEQLRKMRTEIRVLRAHLEYFVLCRWFKKQPKCAVVDCTGLHAAELRDMKKKIRDQLTLEKENHASDLAHNQIIRKNPDRHRHVGADW